MWMQISFGSTFDEKLDGLMRVSVVATGIAAENSNTKPKPQMTLVSSQKDPIAARLEVIRRRRNLAWSAKWCRTRNRKFPRISHYSGQERLMNQSSLNAATTGSL